MIRPLREGNVFYVSPAHSEILILPRNTYLAKITVIKKIGRDV